MYMYIQSTITQLSEQIQGRGNTIELKYMLWYIDINISC